MTSILRSEEAGPAPRPLRRESVALCVREVEVRSALSVLEALRAQPFPWMLESALVGCGGGRFSFVGANPFEILTLRGRSLAVQVLRGVRAAPGELELHGQATDPLGAVRDWMPRLPLPVDGQSERLAAQLPFVGGAVGYFGYELEAGFDRPPIVVGTGRPSQDPQLGSPDAQWLAADRVYVFDALQGRAFVTGLGFGSRAGAVCVARARAAARQLEAALPWPRSTRRRSWSVRSGAPRTASPETVAAAMRAPQARDVSACFDRAQYAEAVRSIKHEISSGNVYQANLTQRLSLPFAGDSLALYRALRALNPAPYASYFEMPGFAVVGSSPERFLRVYESGKTISEPIKGTRPRSSDPAADEVLARELAGSEKDRAENLMIVDLVRNDLGRVCEIGSVEVPSLMRAERYATVHHLVSTVRGQLAAGKDAFDAVAASFPPGSMTGAPKRRAIELLSSIEPVRRGVYSGALGYLDLRGGLDLSVTIRTAVVAQGRVHVNVGGGVVADSDPVAEHQESLDKARALLAAIECVSHRSDRALPLQPPREDDAYALPPLAG